MQIQAQFNKFFLGLLLSLYCFIYSTYAQFLNEAKGNLDNIPNGIGVNIHFTKAKVGELDMLGEAGFRWIRMDFSWSSIEKERGVYNFSKYDSLLKNLDKYGVRAILILDYGNPLYDGGLAPTSDSAIQAFTQWAIAGVNHFKGKNIMWEMWNEPNGGFWKPKPDINAYTKLALATGSAIKSSFPKETLIGPATCRDSAYLLDFDFLEKCFKAGLLRYWSYVSVHPYRHKDPETVSGEYDKLKRIISQYAPKNNTVKVISGEWGYSDIWKGYSEEKQALFVCRQLLINLYNQIPVSILYDWHDDGTDPKNPEKHFGMVRFPYYAGREEVYDKKPAYIAVKNLTSLLQGYCFEKRISTENNNDYVLLFKNKSKICLVAWTTADSHVVHLPITSPGNFKQINYFGVLQSGIVSHNNSDITINADPIYIMPQNQ